MRQQHPNPRELPNKKSQVAEAEPACRPANKKPGILVADDDHLVRIMVQMGLERNGFDVWLAANGREAVDLYQAHREDIAVVLLDVNMPELDGPQALNVLRGLNPEVLACFMTGDPGKYKPDDLVLGGAVSVIPKPFLPVELANTLWLLLQRERGARQPLGGRPAEEEP